MDARPQQFQNIQKKLNATELCCRDLTDCQEINWNNVMRWLINKIRKCQVTCFDHVMRTEKLEHLMTIGMIVGKHSRGKQPEKMLDRLTKWLKVGQVTEVLKAMRDRNTWKFVITYAKEYSTWLMRSKENFPFCWTRFGYRLWSSHFTKFPLLFIFYHVLNGARSRGW